MRSVAKTIGMARDGNAVMALRAPSLAMVLALFSSVSWGSEPAPVDKRAPGEPATKSASKTPRRNVKLPGLVIDFQERCVDVEAPVCLEQGLLELVACTKGSKEQESVVAITARPMHIHAALLLLGAKPGNPAMRKPIDEQETRWIDVPSRGDPADVYPVFRNREGKRVERPISDSVATSEGTAEAQPDDDQDTELPHTFLFAGSLLRNDGPGPRKYLADLSGHVITISTFGDEVLCLPCIHGHQNGSLMWQVDATAPPKVGIKVILRLRPKARPAPKAPMDTNGTGRKAR